MATPKRPKIQLPDGYDNADAFLTEMREIFADNQLADQRNREAGIEDLEFLTGDQWPRDVLAKRQAETLPALVINRLPAFVAQVVGSSRLSDTEIKVIPDNGGTIGAAKVREGLVRSIQRRSHADFAYDTAMVGCVAAGLGNFQLAINYENEDVWDQRIDIVPILDHFAVSWDRHMVEQTGSDADNCLVSQVMGRKAFEARWPWATPADIAESQFAGDATMDSWLSGNDVRIVDYWRMRSHKRLLGLMQDGSTQDLTDADETKLAQVANRADGTPFLREVDRPYAQKYICSGTDILEGPYNLPINRIPVFRVPGWEIRISDRVYRWGILRHMKDPQRLHNYWRTGIAEKIMQSPRSTWTASDESVAGREEAWRQSARSNDPLLIWNGSSGAPPQRVPPIQVEPALIQQAEITSQDLKDVSNIHEANLGMPSNEVSGAAIKARVRVSDTGTAIYQDNMSQAKEECGRIINDLIPIVYDAPRIVRIIGDDSKELTQVINRTGDPNSIDIAEGRYMTTSVTGPSYATKRAESADSMMALATAMPTVLGVAADLIVEAQDWPGADKIATRIRRSLPPQLLSPEEMTPDMQASMQASQQQKAQAESLAQQAAMADYLKTQSEAAVNFARAQNYGQEAQAVGPKLQNETLRTVSEASSRELNDRLGAINIAAGH